MKRALLLLSSIIATSFATLAQESTLYPSSEWDYAKAILMHTPGEELFDGVIHPYAGLFEYYFDVDKAAEEHRGYIDALEQNGVRVYTVKELLNEVPIEKLRECAKNTLTYDTTNMPDISSQESDEYLQYVIGEMSRADLIRCILLRPTVTLYSSDTNTGFEAVYTHSPLMNLYFTRDQSITTPRGHIISFMNSTQRADERWDNVEGIFRVKHPERLKGKHILLVDDVFTTGATIMSLGSAILSAVEDARLSVAVLAASRYGLRVKS